MSPHHDLPNVCIGDVFFCPLPLGVLDKMLECELKGGVFICCKLYVSNCHVPFRIPPSQLASWSIALGSESRFAHVENGIVDDVYCVVDSFCRGERGVRM